MAFDNGLLHASAGFVLINLKEWYQQMNIYEQMQIDSRSSLLPMLS
jgi:hypothetical protein